MEEQIEDLETTYFPHRPKKFLLQITNRTTGYCDVHGYTYVEGQTQVMRHSGKREYVWACTDCGRRAYDIGNY